MNPMQLQARKKLLLNLLCLPLLAALACDQSLVGSLSGQVVQAGTTASVNVNFTAITFPDGADNTLVIELSNLGGHSAKFVLPAKNSSASSLQAKFPPGVYTISEGNFTATLPFQATTVDVSGSGLVQLTAFNVGSDSGGGAAVASISGVFEMVLPEDGFADGDFAKNFAE